MQKTILLTGATDGIGLATAVKLKAEGHNLLLHGRNKEKLESLSKQFKSTSSANIELYRADLSDLNQTQKLAEIIAKKYQHIDVLINNAGVFKSNEPLTKDGLDLRFVVNTLAPYLLTKKLLPLLYSEGRVINLSSAAQAPVNLAALTGNEKIENQLNAYAQSKLAITMWSHQLASALKQSSHQNQPAIIAINPGSLLASKMVKEGFGVAGKDINIGADILLSAALDSAFENASGKYFDNDIGEFSKAHNDVYDKEKCNDLISKMDELLKEYL